MISQLEGMSVGDISRFILPSSFRNDFKILTANKETDVQLLKAVASAVYAMKERFEGIKDSELPTPTEVNKFRVAFLGHVGEKVDDAIADTVGSIASAIGRSTGEKCSLKAAVEYALRRLDNPTFTQKIAEGLSPLKALAETLDDSNVAAHSPAQRITYEDVSSPEEALNRDNRERALAIVQKIDPHTRTTLGLPASTLTNAIVRFQMNPEQFADLAHLKGKGIHPLQYLALRDATGAEHTDVVHGAEVGTYLADYGIGDSGIVIAEFVPTKRLDPLELEKIAASPNTINFENVSAFIEYFGFDPSDLLDEASNCAAAIIELRDRYLDSDERGALNDILSRAIEVGKAHHTRDIDTVISLFSGEHELDPDDRDDVDHEDE